MKSKIFAALTCVFITYHTFAGEKSQHQGNETPCELFGPQTPRDIDNQAGENSVSFIPAPPASSMNLCNIHFHEGAEHKSSDFSISLGEGDHGYGGGYQCNMSKNLSPEELAPTGEAICSGEHGDLKPGDTIEVHWVHTTCDVEPGPTLGACVSSSCTNPQLRVETQVFTLVNDPEALDFTDLKKASDLPTHTGKPVQFLGSTTGPKFTDQVCSPYQVTWSVRPQCTKLDINSVGQWCQGNVFAEDHAHGVRKLVTNPKLLSEIK